ncbi:hypothetical protein tb265_45240 [Gemmatimonadetes bacterium T265]|nr:hypothetical protein tb265_45240 [Gemmatimonadetes bacterium T265]
MPPHIGRIVPDGGGGGGEHARARRRSVPAPGVRLSAATWLQGRHRAAEPAAFRLREARDLGFAKTRLPPWLTAAPLGCVRFGAWFGGTPLARPLQSACARLRRPAPPVERIRDPVPVRATPHNLGVAAPRTKTDAA